MNSQTEYESDNESVNTEQVFDETGNEEIEWDDETVVAPAPPQPEGTATVGGMRTAYDERTAFVEKLQELFAKIEDLNRPTPMNEGEYLEFADLIKDLNQFATLFKKNDPIFVRLVASARRGERKASHSVIAKAEDKTFKWCERCDTHIKKKGWAKHRRSERCLQIFNSKKLAVNITNVEKDKIGRFAKTPIHPFYLIGQSLVSLFGKQKAKDADRVVPEWDAVRLPIQTQQLEDEVGTLESFYEPQEDFSGVIANVPIEHNLTLALILPAEEVAPKEKKARKSRAKKVVAPVEPEPEVVEEIVPSAEEVAENEQMGLEDHDAPAPVVVVQEVVAEVVPEVVAEEPKKKRAYKKKPKPEAEVVAPAEATVVIKAKKPRAPKKKPNLVIEDNSEDEKEVVAEETPAPVQEVAEVPKRYVAEGIMNKSFYETYIREKMSEKGQRLMDAVFGDYEEDEMGVEYRVCSWGNSRDHINEYSEIWFLDCEPEEGYLYPVIVGEINTSSAYAMCRCGMDRDADNEEDEANLMLTDEEILALVKPRNHERILTLLQARRTDGK
jgi:hypothetical protein